MKVMVIVKATRESESGALPSAELLRDMGAFNEELMKAGIMLSGDGLQASDRGVRVHFSGKERQMVKGPFTATNELVAGFWVWQVASMDEAIAWVKRCPNPMSGPSDIEIRPMVTAEDFAGIAPQVDPGTPRFEQASEFLVAGISRSFTAETRVKIPGVWEKFSPYFGDVPTQVGRTAYGVCWSDSAGADFQYLAGVEVKSSAGLPSGFTQLKIAAQNYAVFTHKGHVSKLSETFDAIYSSWLPQSGYKSAPRPALEKYSEAFDPKTGLGGMEVWIPITK